MEKSKEEFEARDTKIQKRIDALALEVRELSRDIRELVRSNRAHERRLRTLEASDRRKTIQVRGIKDLLKLFSKRMDAHSNRLSSLGRNGG